MNNELFTISDFDFIKEFIQTVFNDKFEVIDKYNCSGSIHFTVDNHPFCIMFSKTDYTLWADDGRISLLDKRYNYKNGLSEEVFSHIKEEISNWLNGYIRCTDCGKLINREEVAGHYFAGSYCKDCWEGKWKEIEANETYD